MKMHTWSLPALGLFALLSLLPGCAGEAPEESASAQESSLEAPATLHFGATRVDLTGTIGPGRSARIIYDADRMPTCRGDQGGAPAWSVTGHYRIDGGAVRSFAVAGHRPDGAATPVQIALPNTYARRIEFWFENTNRWGCHAWDSNNGQNFGFDIVKSAAAAGWAGLTKVISTRETCDNGNPCEHAWQPLGAEAFVYDTWTRQRAAIRQVSFEVYKAGITDRANPDIWRDLDVQLFSRIGGAGPFKMSYVNFQKRMGNNARYAIETRTMDPFAMQNTPNTVADCPKFPFKHTGGAGAAYVEATVEFFFRINGVELRPASGDGTSVYKGSFVDYDRFAICP